MPEGKVDISLQLPALYTVLCPRCKKRVRDLVRAEIRHAREAQDETMVDGLLGK